MPRRPLSRPAIPFAEAGARGVAGDVYYNLTKNCLSVRCRDEDGVRRVQCHTAAVLVRKPSLVVSEAGLRRIRAWRMRHVMAWVSGEIEFVEPGLDLGAEAIELRFNPYLFDSFVSRVDNSPVLKAYRIMIDGRRITALI
jgi:hypothetical protein